MLCRGGGCGAALWARLPRGVHPAVAARRELLFSCVCLRVFMLCVCVRVSACVCACVMRERETEEECSSTCITLSPSSILIFPCTVACKHSTTPALIPHHSIHSFNTFSIANTAPHLPHLPWPSANGGRGTCPVTLCC